MSAFLGRPAYAIILNRLRIYCIIFCFIICFPSLNWETSFKRQKNCILYIGIFIYRILSGAVVLPYSYFEIDTGTLWNMLCIQMQRLLRAALSLLHAPLFVQLKGTGLPGVWCRHKAVALGGFIFCASASFSPDLPWVMSGGCWVGDASSTCSSNWLHFEAWLPACCHETYAEFGTWWDAGSPPFISCSTLCSGNCLPVSELCPHM